MIKIHTSHTMQVDIHQLHHQVYILKLIHRLVGCESIEQLNDVLVTNQLHDFELTKRPLGVGYVLKRLGELLDCHRTTVKSVIGGTDHTLSTRPDNLEIYVYK